MSREILIPVLALVIVAALAWKQGILGVVQVVYSLHRWKAGKAPSFGMRRAIVVFVEGMDEGRGVLDLMFGPQLVTAIHDKRRRRGMTVWRAKA